MIGSQELRNSESSQRGVFRIIIECDILLPVSFAENINCGKRNPTAVSFQLAAVCIQKNVRSYIVQCRKKRNVPVHNWTQKCIHYLSTKGPYGRKSINLADRYRLIVVYRIAVLQIQTAWRQYRWLKYLQSIGQFDQTSNAILLQRAWRASVCRRFYRLFHRLLRCHSESLFRQLIAFSSPDNNVSYSIRLGAKSFPVAVHYRIKTPLSSHEPIREAMQIWSIVDQKKFIDFMHEQLQLEDDARRQKIRKTQCTRRRST